MTDPDKDNRFKMTLPDGWEDETVYSYKGPEDSGVQHRLCLVIDRTAGDVEAEEYARARIDATMCSLQSAELVNEGPRTLPSGKQVYEAVCKWVPADDQVIYHKQIFLVTDGVGYTFSANFSKKTLKTIGVEVNGIIDSFAPLPVLEE